MGRIDWICADVGDLALNRLHHAILCDPPYHLLASGSSAGFMNHEWDGGDVAFRKETWETFGRHLYPGAFGLAFASTRGVHRMMVAIEDAGFIIHPTMFGWAFGSGFPKATRIDNQIDKMLGFEQEVVGKMTGFMRSYDGTDTIGGGWQTSPDITEPVSEEAKAFAAYRYGLQALKPAVEPVVMFQKPYGNRAIDDMLRYRCGALNIMNSLVGDEEVVTRPRNDELHRKDGIFLGTGWSGITDESPREGRWPANLFLIHSSQCTEGECLCEAASFEQRHFFLQAYWSFEVLERMANSPLIFYTPKASPKERDAGLEARPLSTTDDGRNKPIDNPYLRGETERQNPHPTVKPVTLTKWLSTLLLPPDMGEPRRILVPFSGVGSEAIGSLLSGWEIVTAVELSESYISISKQRAEWWETVSRQLGLTDVDEILRYAVNNRKKQTNDITDLPLFRNINN